MEAPAEYTGTQTPIAKKEKNKEQVAMNFTKKEISKTVVPGKQKQTKKGKKPRTPAFAETCCRRTAIVTTLFGTFLVLKDHPAPARGRDRPVCHRSVCR